MTRSTTQESGSFLLAAHFSIANLVAGSIRALIRDLFVVFADFIVVSVYNDVSLSTLLWDYFPCMQIRYVYNVDKWPKRRSRI